MADKKQLLKRYWHHTVFRPCQEEIIDSLLQGRDVFAMMPTGGGKSLCYQLPPLLMDGLCLVVTPLIALMKDQVQRLNDMHLKAACLYAGLSTADMSVVLNNAMCGTLKYLYVSPERLTQRMFIEHFRRMKVCLIAVDEAHCVSQWGYDFRPPYMQVGAIRQYQQTVPMIALTATATPAVADDVCRLLALRSPCRFSTGFDRPNLTYSVVHTEDKMTRLLHICRTDGACGVVYAATRRRTESIAAFLSSNGVEALCYHAGLAPTERDRRQKAWMTGGCNVMVATNAFGMGVDKADVRFVVHVDAPDCLESYYQEAGRAGRDGLPAKAVLLYDNSDGRRLDETLELDFPPVSHIRNAYKALCNYYRIPTGSGIDTKADFKMEKICDMYNMPLREFFSCCRILERHGLIAIDDGGIRKSTLFITVPRNELYRFQVDHMKMGDMLMTAMRLYPGISDEHTPIDEGRLARHSMCDTKEVKTMLHKMAEMKIVEYQPATDMPQIVFCSERIDERSISFGSSGDDALKEAARGRMAAMRQYAESEGVCRSRMLRNYLGETDGVCDCGRCDVCVRQRHADIDVEQAVRQAVAQGHLSVGSLCEMLGEQNYVGVDVVVRRMLDSGELHLDRNLFLSLS